MPKRNGTGSSRSRKKMKGAAYASVDLDLSDEHCDDVEVVRVWDVSTSKTSGRVSATRKTHQHVNNDGPRPTHEEPTPTVEDVDVPADTEPAKPATKHKREKVAREKVARENDSVSCIPRSSSNLIFTVDRRR